MIPWLDSLPQYCEHVFLGHPDQPANIYSNGVFLAAALLVFLRRRELPGRFGEALVLMLLAVGGAGAWWHYAGTAAAYAASFGAGAALIVCLAFLVLRYVFFWPIMVCLAGVMALAPMAYYAPSWNFLWVGKEASLLFGLSALLIPGGIWLGLIRHSNAGLFLLMTSFSLAGGAILLTLDMPACAGLKTGTHCAWHLMAACAAYFTIRSVASADIELFDDQNIVDGLNGETVPPAEDPGGETQDRPGITPQ